MTVFEWGVVGLFVLVTVYILGATIVDLVVWRRNIRRLERDRGS